MAKFIQLTAKSIKNLPLTISDDRVFDICINTDHIVLARPIENSDGCFLIVDNQCSSFYREDINELEARCDIRTIRAARILVEESYEQVRKNVIKLKIKQLCYRLFYGL